MNQTSSKDIVQLRSEVVALLEKVGERLDEANLPKKDRTPVLIKARRKFFWFSYGYSHHMKWKRIHLLPFDHISKPYGVTASGDLVLYRDSFSAYDAKGSPIQYRSVYGPIVKSKAFWQAVSIEDADVSSLHELRSVLLKHLA